MTVRPIWRVAVAAVAASAATFVMGPVSSWGEQNERARSNMVEIPGGCFELGGGDTEDDLDENPRYEVCLEPYLIDPHEVTVKEYQRCVAADACAPLPDHRVCRQRRTRSSRAPANCVMYAEADAYCAWAGKRLPMDAEWERAARGPKLHTYPWGDLEPTARRAQLLPAEAWKRQGHLCCLEPTTLAPVCAHPGGNSAEGLCDMVGNVAEWVSGWWDYAERGPELVHYERRPREGGVFHVLRGGGINKVGFVQGYRRYLFSVSSLEDSATEFAAIGFRCAADAPGGRGAASKTLGATDSLRNFFKWVGAVLRWLMP